MYELAIHYNLGQVQIKDISEAQSIPQHYLEQLLVLLKKAGFIQSYRGKQGGYALAHSPGQLKVIDILTCLEGELNFTRDNTKDTLDFFWKNIEREIKKMLDNTLEELILQKKRFDKRLDFII